MDKDFTERKSFVVYCYWEDMLKALTDEEKGRFFMALFNYEKYGELPMNDLKIEMAFSLVKEKLDADIVSYQVRCRANANNGKKGGRPRLNNPNNPMG